MMDFESKAINDAEKIVEALERKSEKQYMLGCVSQNERHIDIFEVDEDGSYRLFTRFTGSTWKDAYYSVHGALNLLYGYVSVIESVEYAKKHE